MKTPYILIGLLTCGLLSGCAHDQSKPTSSNVSQSNNVTVIGQSGASFVVASTNGAPLSYQWQVNGTNISGVTINGTSSIAVRIIGSDTSSVTNQ
jgi:hypothetical protein